MACNYETIFATMPGGSDIDFAVRYKDGGSYPDISDTVMRVTGTLDGNQLFDISSDNPQLGSTVTVTSDGTGDLINIHIDGALTVGKTGTLQIASVLTSAETGRRTEVAGRVVICEGGGL